MSMFSKTKAVIWPKAQSTEIYLDKAENNIFSVDVNLLHPCTSTELQSLNTLLKDNGISECTILIPDDVVYTKSFIYDSEIKEIDKNEVIGLANSFITFKIDPESIDYKLVPSSGKTIIQSHIFEREKMAILESNLKFLGLKSFSFESVSGSIAKVISQKYNGEYFLIYALGGGEYTLLLAKGDSVYLTSPLKGKELEVQKLINYSKLYFPSITSKFYVPSDLQADIKSTLELDKTPFNQSNLATELKKPANLPLPVLGVLISKESSPVIINVIDTSLTTKNMDNKKNILPFIAVFVVTAAIASIIIYLVISKNNSAVVDTPLVDAGTPTESATAPTTAPSPTVAEISKALKLQVLNATEINGQAAVLKEKLTALGFTSVTVGNSKDKLTANAIKIKATDKTSSAYFADQLAGFFDATVSSDLAATSTYDVVFYIGTKLDSASTGTVAPTTVATKSATTVTPTP